MLSSITRIQHRNVWIETLKWSKRQCPSQFVVHEFKFKARMVLCYSYVANNCKCRYILSTIPNLRFHRRFPLTFISLRRVNLSISNFSVSIGSGEHSSIYGAQQCHCIVCFDDVLVLIHLLWSSSKQRTKFYPLLSYSSRAGSKQMKLFKYLKPNRQQRIFNLRKRIFTRLDSNCPNSLGIN